MSGIKSDTSGREVYNLDTSGSGGGAGGSVTIDQTTPGTTNGVQVNSSALPTGAATSSAQATGNTSLASIDTKLTSPLGVTGNVAGGATDSGNPVKIGAKYNATLPTYTDGQRAELAINAKGELITVTTSGVTGADGQGNGTLAAPIASSGSAGTMLSVGNYLFNGTSWDRARGDVSGTVVQPHAMTGSRIQYAAASGGISNTNTAVTMFAAAGAGLRNYITGLQLMSEALTNATELAIRDGAAGTVIWRTKIGTGGITGGISLQFPVPLKGTANTLMEVVTLTASGAGAVYVNAQGFTAA